MSGLGRNCMPLIVGQNMQEEQIQCRPVSSADPVAQASMMLRFCQPTNSCMLSSTGGLGGGGVADYLDGRRWNGHLSVNKCRRSRRDVSMLPYTVLECRISWSERDGVGGWCGPSATSR
jgi:hypothetical protein